MFKSNDVDEEQLLRNIKSDFQVMEPIRKLSYFRTWFTCQSKYKKMLLKSESSITKELDLRKFIYRQRVTMTALLGLLSGRQSFFIDKLSQLVIRESSNLEETSSDADLSDWQHDNMDYAKRMALSSNQTDQKFMNLYRIRKAHEAGIYLGFSNPGSTDAAM